MVVIVEIGAVTVCTVTSADVRDIIAVASEFKIWRSGSMTVLAIIVMNCFRMVGSMTNSNAHRYIGYMTKSKNTVVSAMACRCGPVLMTVKAVIGASGFYDILDCGAGRAEGVDITGLIVAPATADMQGKGVGPVHDAVTIGTWL